MSNQHHLPSYKASLPVTENYPCCRTYRHRALSLHLRTQVASSSCLTWRCCVRCCSRFNALIVARRPCMLGRPVQWWATPWRLLWRAGAVVVSCRVYSHHRGWRLIPTNARSVELPNAEYTSLLGDGDAAVLSALNTLRPYGADVEIVKHECINHISKRMYRGLEKVVKDAKSAVGCGLGGKGKLTQVRMKKWSQYYRNAVVKHAPDVAKTRDAIWAIYQHSVSTEDDPQHDNCDVDWCWWQQAMAAGVDPEERRREGRHDPPLPLPAAERLLPLFERLSKPDLLERCMSLGTSNANESLHSVIWRRASKAVFATRSTVEIAVAFGVVQFNCGGRVLLDASNAVITLPESSSNQLAVVAANMDRRRLKQGSRTAKEESKTARKRKSLARLSAEASHTEAEGHLYSAGAW